jgi:hypothetical protein
MNKTCNKYGKRLTIRPMRITPPNKHQCRIHIRLLDIIVGEKKEIVYKLCLYIYIYIYIYGVLKSWNFTVWKLNQAFHKWNYIRSLFDNQGCCRNVCTVEVNN